MVEAEVGELLELLRGGGGEVDAVGMVDARGDGLDLVGDGTLEPVGEAEVVGLVAEAHDLASQRLAALAALGPDLGERDVDAELLALGLDEVELGLGVRGEGVDGDDDVQAEDLLHVLDVLEEVRQASLERLEVLRTEVGLGNAAVVLERAHGRHDDAGGGGETGSTALDVAELLGTEVRAEACLGDDVVAELERGRRRDDRVAAVGDVGKGSAVDEGGRVLERLDEVRHDRVLEKRRHGTLGVQVMSGHGVAVEGVGDDHAAETGLEVGEVGGEAEHGHDLRGDGDVEAVLPRHAVGDAAHAVDDVPELTVVHVDAAAPDDASRVDAEGVALLDVVVEHRGEEVVRRADGVEVAREVEVDVLHGDDLCVSAAGRTSLDAEDGTEARLAQREDDALPEAMEGVGETHGGRGLALASRCGVDGRHEDELALLRTVLEGMDVNLGLGVAVGLEHVLREPDLLGDLRDGKHLSFLCDLDV